MFVFAGGGSADVLIGGALDDTVYSGGGIDRLVGGGGNDVFRFLGDLAPDDRVNGGGGTDQLFLNGDYSTELVFAASTLSGVDVITFEGANDYFLTLHNGNLAADGTLIVDGAGASSLIFDASDEGGGNLFMTGGDGNDALTGGGRNDLIIGGNGNDVLTGLLGEDRLRGDGGADLLDAGLPGDFDGVYYRFVSESTSTTYDTVFQFNATEDGLLEDRFFVTAEVFGVDRTIGRGTLNAATFDADMAAAVHAGRLDEFHAVVFVPDEGDLHFKFLVIDQNGVAGYQAGEDIVISLILASHLRDLSAAHFAIAAP
jgi:Ca2+-binding RTX toxin-like protein